MNNDDFLELKICKVLPHGVEIVSAARAYLSKYVTTEELALRLLKEVEEAIKKKLSSSSVKNML